MAYRKFSEAIRENRVCRDTPAKAAKAAKLAKARPNGSPPPETLAVVACEGWLKRSIVRDNGFGFGHRHIHVSPRVGR
jgi:hypothetical protein